MQLTPEPRTSTVRARLRAAACVLLAAGMPAVARAEAAATWRLDASGLAYAEQGRSNVVEPQARMTRLFANGQSLSLQLGLDTITGASPTGAQPTGRVQTTTTPSGNTNVTPGDQIPTAPFKDIRGALDLEWVRPLGFLTATTGGHVSREKDYQSLGGSAVLSADLMQRLTTVSVGGGYNDDSVFPAGGIHAGLMGSGAPALSRSSPKHVTTTMLGLSRILTRRWMVGATLSRTREDGYLTEPYKLLSVLDGEGYTTDLRSEKRPSTRDRTSLQSSSVYHLAQDVLYLDHRYYRDDWGVKSNTVDLRYRKELGDDTFLQPHVRLYAQSAADFFRFGLRQGEPLPAYATSDYRLGPMRTVTVGATYGFHLFDYPGQFTVRAEYMGQWGTAHPSDAVGVLRQFDLMPLVSIGTLLVGYSRTF
jgi:hypothetical protein